MGYSILELVLRTLRQYGFHANIAYPGQKFPQISNTAVAVHIEKVDRANLTVTVEVNVICPAAMGGTECEVTALRATEVLRWQGAVCVQNGCSYDGVSQVYVVPVLATFTGVTEAEDCQIGPGFRVYINGVYHSYVTRFQEEEQTGFQAVYETGESCPVGTCRGTRGWSLELEELIPAGSPELAEPGSAFTLRVETDQKTESYYGCRWTQVQREFTQKGLRRIRKGIAMDREETDG